MSKPIVLSSTEWNTSSLKYMPPKVNDRGGMSINIISTQTNRSLHISTPMMMTWGISDYVENGEGDGKFSMSLNFPNDDYKKPSTDAFLQRMQDYENQILDDAVKNSELWWGEEMSREVCKHSFFPFLKYQNIKGTKKRDPSRPPSIKAKVPCYDGKWGIELYDTKDNMIYPCDNERVTPCDYVPKLSNVACVLQCGGIWKGGKGWGVTWRVIQCVVKPREVVSVYGQCRVVLSDEDRGAIDSQTIQDVTDEQEDTPATVFKAAEHDVIAEDSDNEDAVEEEEEAVVVEQEAVVEEPVAIVKKKVIKKKTEVVSEGVSDVPVKKMVKKVIKKKVIEATA